MKLNGNDIVELKQSIPVKKYNENEAYYVGKNTSIIEQRAKRSPDNRVPIAYANRLIKSITGYAARTGDIFTKWEQQKESSDLSFVDAYDDIKESNMLELLNSRLYKTALKQGIAYDVVWTEKDDDGNVKIKASDIDVRSGIPIYSDNLEIINSLDAFVRYYQKNYGFVDDKGVEYKAGQYAQVYYKGYYQIWYLKKDEKIRNTSFDPILMIEQEQPFSEVQVSYYKCNDENITYWQPVKEIIDQFDKLISKNMNETDRFNDSWLMLMQKVSPDTKRKIDEMGIIDNLQAAVTDTMKDVFPKFLERNIPVDHANMMIETLEKLLYTIIGVPSFLDESFNSSSGIALLYKLIGLEYSAIETDTYFDIGVKNRNKLFKEALGELGKYNNVSVTKESIENHYDVIEHKRNLPLDTTTIVNEAVQLRMAGVSMESIIKYLPEKIIPDVEAELERINEEQSTLSLDTPIMTNDVPTATE